MFTKQSHQQRHCNQTKTARWLIIPALIILGVVEHNLRESRVKADFTRLEQRGTDEEAQAVEDLVEGCAARRFNHWLPSYLAERQRGNCRSLAQAPLFGASIQSVSLSNADLREADLRYANLTLTYFRFTDFRGANLSNAVLRFNDLREANLSNANLSNADLR